MSATTIISQLLRGGTQRALLFAVLIALLLQIPFALLFYLPDSEFGVPGPGILFFLPSLALVSLFPLEQWPLVVAVVVCQTFLTSIPVFWILTWRTRSVLSSVLRFSSFVVVIVIASSWLIPFERQRA